MSEIPILNKKRLKSLWEQILVPKGYESLTEFPLKGKELLIVPCGKPTISIQNMGRNAYKMEFVK